MSDNTVTVRSLPARVVMHGPRPGLSLYATDGRTLGSSVAAPAGAACEVRPAWGGFLRHSGPGEPSWTPLAGGRLFYAQVPGPFLPYAVSYLLTAGGRWERSPLAPAGVPAAVLALARGEGHPTPPALAPQYSPPNAECGVRNAE